MASFKQHITSFYQQSLKWLKRQPTVALMMLVIIGGALLRSYHLKSKAILFGDAGRDLLIAQEAVEAGYLPLVGIPSSVPRFHQGPLTVWLQMAIYLLVGHQTLVYSLIFALISLLAIIALYELASTQLSPKVGLVSATLLAFSPLAIAQGRMPYHTNPIPLVVCAYLFSLIWLWRKKRWPIFISVLGWSLMMQFELSLFALGLLIPYVIWRSGLKLRWSHLSEFSAALLFGFWPQLIHDLTRPLEQNQLGAFIAWVGYRLLSGLGFFETAHQLSVARLDQALNHFLKYGGRLFSGGHWLNLALALLTIALAGLKLLKNQQKLPALIELTGLATLLLTLSYLVHGAPSEAYFPPYLVLLPLLVGYSLVVLFKGHFRWLLLVLAAYTLLNFITVFNLNFFVSNSEEFSYGPRIGEQREIIKLVTTLSQGDYQWRTTDEYGRFPSYFAGYRWLAQEMDVAAPNPAGQVFYLEKPGSGLAGYPNLVQMTFPSRELYY